MKIELIHKSIGSEYGIPIILVCIETAQEEDCVLKECKKYLPYRLVELKPNYTVDLIRILLIEGFEIIVNLDSTQEVSRIPRGAKIKLTIPVAINACAGIENLSSIDEIIFKITDKKEVDDLNNILLKFLTRAMVTVKVKNKEIIKYILEKRLPVKIIEDI